MVNQIAREKAKKLFRSLGPDQSIYVIFQILRPEHHLGSLHLQHFPCLLAGGDVACQEPYLCCRPSVSIFGPSDLSPLDHRPQIENPGCDLSCLTRSFWSCYCYALHIHILHIVSGASVGVSNVRQVSLLGLYFYHMVLYRIRSCFIYFAVNH